MKQTILFPTQISFVDFLNTPFYIVLWRSAKRRDNKTDTTRFLIVPFSPWLSWICTHAMHNYMQTPLVVTFDILFCFVLVSFFASRSILFLYHPCYPTHKQTTPPQYLFPLLLVFTSWQCCHNFQSQEILQCRYSFFFSARRKRSFLLLSHNFLFFHKTAVCFRFGLPLCFWPHQEKKYWSICCECLWVLLCFEFQTSSFPQETTKNSFCLFIISAFSNLTQKPAVDKRYATDQRRFACGFDHDAGRPGQRRCAEDRDDDHEPHERYKPHSSSRQS